MRKALPITSYNVLRTGQSRAGQDRAWQDRAGQGRKKVNMIMARGSSGQFCFSFFPLRSLIAGMDRPVFVAERTSRQLF